MLRRSSCAWLGAAAAVVLTAFGAAWAHFTGPRDPALYPPAEASPYRLPWPAGTTWRCIQGNRGVVSHRGPEEFAYDFGMPVGSEVCAARGGVVDAVDVSHDGHGLRAPNNQLRIDHGDGTFGRYLHLRKDGALVRKGETVRQGQPIGLSGHVGRSLTPHLHFEVARLTPSGRVTLPVTFADVPNLLGIPRMGLSYASGNPAPVTTDRPGG